MIQFQIWEEILASMKRNKLKTALTGFAVAWGIFMLIVLLAAGNGLKNGMALNYKDDSKLAVWVWSGRTNLAYKGLPTKRNIQFTNTNETILRKDFNTTVGELSPLVDMRGKNVMYKNEKGMHDVRGVLPEFVPIESLEMLPNQGRFINQLDCEQKRKVVVVSSKFVQDFFKDESPIGKQLSVDGIMFTVIGVFKEVPRSWQKLVYIPLPTAQQLYGFGDKVHELSFNLSLQDETNVEESKQIMDNIKHRFASYHQFDAEDEGAMGYWNTLENFLFTQKLFAGISIFVWIVGIGTLIAGIVGISNIMLISVKERTKEFGIRRALGAKPSSIIVLVVLESIIITAVFGYIGMVLGVALTEGIDFVMRQMPVDETGAVFFYNPTIELNLVIAATLLLIVAGVIAGYFPARRAVKIKPIDALRDE
jgi:putative ABC transport system permease protein